jgi:hypothetical protein
MSRNGKSSDVQEAEGEKLGELDTTHHESKEKEKKRRLEDVDSKTTSSASSQHHEANQDEDGQNQPRDLEALSTVQTNSPPYSIFTKRQKYFIVCLTAWAGFFSPLSANIYFPALTTLTREYGVSSTLMNLTLTSYMIFQGLAPTIFGDLADMA